MNLRQRFGRALRLGVIGGGPASWIGQMPRGHPEGLREAFANLHAEIAQERIARELGEDLPPPPYPRIEDGVHTMVFIEACLASQASGRWADVAEPTTTA